MAKILLQKSAAADGPWTISLSAVGFDPPALTLSTQLPRYAIHRAPAGGGRATSEASRRRFWAIAARTNSSWAPRGPRSRSRPSFRMRLRCANRISIFLRSRRDCSKSSVPTNDRATSRACSWISRGILRDGSFWAALRFEWAYVAVELAGARHFSDVSSQTDDVRCWGVNGHPAARPPRPLVTQTV